MAEDFGILGPEAGIVALVYLATLLFLGWYGNKMKKEATMADHFLAGRELGHAVLFLTMFSSLFSGYTVVGLPANAYQAGYLALSWVTGTAATQLGFTLIAPQLQVLGLKHGFISPTAYTDYRYNYRPLSFLMSFCILVPTAIYTLAQFNAVGSTVAGLTRNAIHPSLAAAILGMIILFYEYLGGMRSVVWTDAVQGSVILVAFVFMAVLLKTQLGGLEATVPGLQESAPELLRVPPRDLQVNFLTFCILLSCFPLYPHLMQRAFAARDARRLRTTTGILVWMPPFISTVSLVLGVIAASKYSGTGRISHPDETFSVIATDLMQTSRVGYWTVTIMLCAALAALMSTVDSLLMALASAFVTDVVRGHFLPGRGDAFYLRLSHIIILAVIVVDVGVTSFKPTLTSLLTLQSNILIQSLPAFALGLSWKAVRGPAVFWGTAAGLILCITSMSAGLHTVGGAHIGVVTSLIAALVIVGLTLRDIRGHRYVRAIEQAKLGRASFYRAGDEASKDKAASKNQRAKEGEEEEGPLTDWSGEPNLAGASEVTGNQYPLDRSWYPVVLLMSLVMCLPWYRTPGATDAVLGGMPVWAVVSLFFTCLMCALVSYGCYAYWPDFSPEFKRAINAAAAARAVSAAPGMPPTLGLGEIQPPQQRAGSGTDTADGGGTGTESTSDPSE